MCDEVPPEGVGGREGSPVFAVIGVQAVREVSDLFGLELDGNNRFTQLEHDRRRGPSSISTIRRVVARRSVSPRR